MLKELPRVEVDGIAWIPRAGSLWCPYEDAQIYAGCSSPAAVRNYVFRHGIRRIRHGGKILVEKAGLDRACGLEPPPTY